MTDSPHEPNATHEGATAAGDARAEDARAEDARAEDARAGDARAEEARAEDARADAVGDEAAAEDAVLTDDAGAEASAAAAAAAYAANADEDLAAEEALADPAAAEGEETNEDPDGADEIDLDALADADPRSKAELLGELVVAENKRDEYLDDLRRSHADFENYRRRILREGAAQRDAGKADLAGPLLEVLDDLDRTLVAADGSPDTDLAKGVALVASKFTTTLTRVGLQRVEATGVAFDPNVHEAVQQQPADEPAAEPVVVQVLRPGYCLGQRTLRAAMVVVEQ